LRGNPQNSRQFGASLYPLGASLKPLEWLGLGLQLRQGRTLVLLPRGPVPVVGS
jgi:hypothetical protein